MFLFVLGSFVIACSAKVDRFPLPGESLRAGAFTVEAGGKGLNVAVGARRLGVAVDGLLAVGDDLFGGLAEPTLDRAGLPLSMIRRRAGGTGAGIGFTDAHGENCLAVFPGANRLLSAADVRTAPGLTRAALVAAQFEIDDAPIAEAFMLARAAGVRTLLTPSPYREPAAGLLSTTDILVLNAVEAAQMAGSSRAGQASSPEDAAALGASLLARGPDLVVITLGPRGAVACRRGTAPLHQPAFPVTAVDSLGAGDAFTAALAAGLVQGRPLTVCLERAAACGAIVAGRLGVFDALPSADQLDRYLRPAD
ncbi:ribokinase [Azospirillum picis]|uniref:Ribokinase n=1 Tax=Azospirillum picis TaxID=488438 RepID=A0ABU0MQX3_9PROT|nr:ribokinase [Azospirillum picis]MBP2301661.1 ribokinase [Azospirillum picis]MDQ0535516.1 ribokinase [Azospirillum picis]